MWFHAECKLGNRDWSRDERGYSAQEEAFAKEETDVWRWYRDAVEFKLIEERKLNK
jgi:hypothetical protein